MRKYIKFGKRCLSSFIAMILSFMMISPVSVFAAEPVDESELALRAAGVTREEAVAMFDLTEEEAEHATFYYVDDSPSSIQTRGVVDVNNPWNPSAFHFTGRNVGSYQTMNGNKLKFRMLWKPDAGDGSEFCWVYLYPYGQNYVYSYLFTLASPVYASDSSYRDFTSSWINITYGLDYHFIYESKTGHGEMYPRDYGCTMKVLVVVV